MEQCIEKVITTQWNSAVKNSFNLKNLRETIINCIEKNGETASIVWKMKMFICKVYSGELKSSTFAQSV